MREITENIILPPLKDKIILEHIPEYDIEDYDLNKPKELMRFLFSIERLCRNSRSYKKLIGFLKEYLDMNQCSFYKNSNNIDTNGLKIHIHHSPLTLFDIVSTIYNKRKACGQSITPNMIAKETMFNHYKLLVGLIPLSETVHEIVHNGGLFIPTSVTYGYYQNFVKQYEPYMDKELLRILSNAEELSEKYDYAKQTKILTVKMVYIDPSGEYEFPSYKDLSNLLLTKIDQSEKGEK